MKKLIDFDGLFDEKLSGYMRENASKYTERQWESLIAKLYKQYGDTYVALAGDTPRGYYAKMTDGELIETLRRHIAEDVPVSDFLCRAIEERRPEELFSLIGEGDERIVTLAVNLAGEDERAYPAYFSVLEKSGDEELKDAVCEQLKTCADRVKARALACYTRGIERERMLEILSRCRERDDAVFEILMRAFREAEEELPMRASYLAAYGDRRALPTLLEVIDRDDINYLEYQELRYAIEALGGEYSRPRDFSDDEYYQEIQAQSRMPVSAKNGAEGEEA